jgi:hypothetical protein
MEIEAEPRRERWIFITLLRHYVSLIAQGKHEYIENHAVKLVKQALGVLDYKTAVYNILGWLHIYG